MDDRGLPGFVLENTELLADITLARFRWAFYDKVFNDIEEEIFVTDRNGKVTGYTCKPCGAVAIEAPNYASIPSDADVITGNWYFPAVAASTTTTTSSPKTFDAGIAMYVGMALTSVAGSAVVIGKKKEF